MQRKKTGYFLLYLLSFTISTGIFHAVAHAQEVAQYAPNKVHLVEPFTNVPTPTVFVQSPISAARTSTVNTTTTPTPSQGPTIEVKGTITTQPTPTAPIPTATLAPTAVPTAVPTPIAVETVAPTDNASVISEEALTYLGNCETGMNPTKNTGNGYYGAFQFSQGTWNSMNTGYERADFAPLEVQKAAVKQLLQRSSIHTQFPGCARKMKSTGLI